MTKKTVQGKAAGGPVNVLVNVFEADHNMARFLRRVAPDFARRQDERLRALGAFAAGRLEEQAQQSDRHFPARLEMVMDHPTAPTGRKGKVVLNPEYEACQQHVYSSGFMAPCFDARAPESQLLPFIYQYYLSYADIATGCPPAMTHPITLLLATMAPQAVRDRFLPEMLRTDGQTPVGGTWATERHSGSDVGHSVTTAVAQPGEDTHRLHGHNWFTSAIGFKKFLTIKTARPLDKKGRPQDEGSAGLGLYLVPSHLDSDWTVPNEIAITHLKEKMGTRGLPTGEVTLDGTVAYEIAPAGEGLRGMMAALGCSRVHNAMAAAGVMYRCYREALGWAQARETFGAKLVTRPMIRDDILDIATEWMAGAALAGEAARVFDEHHQKPGDKKITAWMRTVTALAKYRTAEQAVRCAKTALEVVGGNGYAKDHPMERIYRDAMVLTVWEGPRHIQALELMRMLAKDGARAYMDGLRDRMVHWPAALQPLRSRIAPLVTGLQIDLETLGRQPELAEGAAGRLLDRMADIAAVVLLADEAAWELQHEQDATKLAVAGHLFEKCFARDQAPLLTPPPLRACFDALVAGRPVAPPERNGAGGTGGTGGGPAGPRP